MLDNANRDRQSERRAATRDEILTAAWDLAREKGLAELTLRDVAVRVGMRAPSLYSYFDSKNAIHDAMYGQAWFQYLGTIDALEARLPKAPRAALKRVARSFFEFAVADLARFQLMNQRILPGFAPSAASYAPAVEVLHRAKKTLFALGVTRAAHFDLYIALVGGLVDAQLANDPGGNRWERLLDDAVDMFADHVGIPATRKART